MRRAALIAALAALAALAACERPVNRIEVVATEAASAHLALCGRAPLAMPKTADGFALRIPADCRGSGEVILTYADGGSVACHIRIVVADMAAWYRFQVAGRTCRMG